MIKWAVLFGKSSCFCSYIFLRQIFLFFLQGNCVGQLTLFHKQWIFYMPFRLSFAFEIIFILFIFLIIFSSKKSTISWAYSCLHCVKGNGILSREVTLRRPLFRKGLLCRIAKHQVKEVVSRAKCRKINRLYPVTLRHQIALHRIKTKFPMWNYNFR